METDLDRDNGVAVIDLVLDMAGEDRCDIFLNMDLVCRSEERRVGKECPV